MRFSQAWAEVIKFNQNLKISIAVSVITIIILGITTIHFSMKAPIIIERSCYSKFLNKINDKSPSKLEYKTFIEISLKQRFNTIENIIDGYLSTQEKKNKYLEQKKLAKNKIIQFIIIRNIDFKDGIFFINADRLYSVNNIRSALPIKLKVTIKNKNRTQTNPYGLILDLTEELDTKTKENK